jgi:hypothetical protein
MAENRLDFTSMGRDLVMKVLDRVADRITTSSSQGVIQQIATSWKSMTPDERAEIARHVTVGVEAALAMIPLAAAAAASRRAAAKKKAKDEKKKTGKKKKKKAK